MDKNNCFEMSTSSLIVFLTKIQTSFPIYKISDEKKFTEIRNWKLAPSSSDDEIFIQNCQT